MRFVGAFSVLRSERRLASTCSVESRDEAGLRLGEGEHSFALVDDEGGGDAVIILDVVVAGGLLQR